MKKMTYQDFLKSKIVKAPEFGIVEDIKVNPALFPHQADICRWAIRGGRRGYGIDLNSQSFADGVNYLKSAEHKLTTATLFDVAEYEVKQLQKEIAEP